ncbi:hypothetical protein DL95DRAFT_416011 [Leptodontidium sp. 2 PMI_412]|nr:hypothetical protein DL95DRAFT_416011 [Leptodontidium sp. 2 PMI_412]
MPNLYRSTENYIIGRGSTDGEGDVAPVLLPQAIYSRGPSTNQLGGIWDYIALVDPEQETCDNAVYDDERSGGEDVNEDSYTGYEPKDEVNEGDLDDDESMDKNSEASQPLGSSRGMDELRELVF